MQKQEHKIRLVFLFIGTLLFSACSEQKVSAEEEIKQFIAAGKQAAENRSANALSELISDSYRDTRNHEKKSIKKLSRAYFFRHKNIHLYTHIDDITLQTEKQAFVTVYVAMAGRKIADIESLNRLRARVYKFELQLIRTDEWLLEQANWQPASIQNLF